MFVDKEKISAILNQTIEDKLSELYAEYGVKVGDISPEQEIQWDKCISDFADLFENLISQNLEEKQNK